MRWIKSLWLLVSVSALTTSGCASRQPVNHAGEATAAPANQGGAAVPGAAPGPALLAESEQIRTDCIAGRRLICGKVLKVLPDGLVVDSGYTDLLRPPLTESWVIPGTVSVSRNPVVLELKQPGTPAIGLVVLTDIPKRPKPKVFDYVVIMGYPAGSQVYEPAPAVQKTLRRFAAGLDTAVRLRVQASGDSH